MLLQNALTLEEMVTDLTLKELVRFPVFHDNSIFIDLLKTMLAEIKEYYLKLDSQRLLVWGWGGGLNNG